MSESCASRLGPGGFLRLPPAHRLGKILGISAPRSTSKPSSRQFVIGPPVQPLGFPDSSVDATSKDEPDGGDVSLTDDAQEPVSKKIKLAPAPGTSGDQRGGLEETDAGASLVEPKGKGDRPVISAVQTHDEEPFAEFSVFLPPKVPQVVLSSPSALSTFVNTMVHTCLQLWPVSASVTTLDLRFPNIYSNKLSSNVQFISQYLSSVLQRLSKAKVRSVDNVFLPQITLHSMLTLHQALSPLLASRLTITNLYLSIHANIKKKGKATVPVLSASDHDSLASVVSKSNVKQIKFLSSNQAVHKTLLVELVNKRKHIPTAYAFDLQDSSFTGPAYLTDESEQASQGEYIDPHTLVLGLNCSVVERIPVKRSAVQPSSRKKSKAPPKQAYTTDCTYNTTVTATVDGPFTSEMWNLEELHQKGITGAGTTIAVIDSGINYFHSAFQGRIVAVKNFVSSSNNDIDCAIDSDGHGTLCAGIAAGDSFYSPERMDDPDSPSLLVPPGVAPKADLVICKVVDTNTGEVDNDAFLAALEWLRDYHTHRKIDVISISLASTYFSLARATVISDLVSSGAIVVCCASNVGRMRLQPIAFPSRLGHVLCIGAHDENGKPTSFSPVGRELDFLAPGEDIWGPGPGTAGPFAMDCASGTSCATPAVAGLVCLVLHAIDKLQESKSSSKKYQIAGKPLVEHVKNVWVMRELFKAMSSSPGHHSEEVGYGTLNPYRLLNSNPSELLRIIDEIIEDQ